MENSLKKSLLILTLALTCTHSQAAELKVELAKDGTIIEIVKAGESGPDNKSAYRSIFPINDIPLLGFNNDSQVAFLDILFSAASERSSIIRIAVGSANGLTEIVRTGQPSPDSNGSFSASSAYSNLLGGEGFPFHGPGFHSFDSKCLRNFSQGISYKDPKMAFPNLFNAKGQVAFLDTLTGTNGGNDDNIGIFVGGAGSIHQIARSGPSILDSSLVFSGFSLPVINNKGDVAFEATIWTRAEDSTYRYCTVGIFLVKNGDLIEIARSSAKQPTLIGRFVDLGPPVINNKGQAAFVGYLPGFMSPGLAGQPIAALYLANGSTLVEIARSGQLTPDGNGKYLDFTNPTINDQGQVAFQSVLTETKQGGRDNNGIFLATADKIIQIARSGQPAPDGNGIILDFSFPILNNTGQVTFAVTYTGATRAKIHDTAIFRSTTGGELRQIARAGFPAADRNGRVSAVGLPRINNKGQVAFNASFIETREPNTDNIGIYLGDGETLAEVVRPGQAAPEGKGKFGAIGPPLINDSGQIAFGAQLAGTDRGARESAGIYIWSPGQK